MTDERWIVVPNWARFQHYSDRTPPWIKLYTELNSKDEWLQLSCAERGLLVTIWVEFARSCGQVRLENVRRLCGSSAREKHLVSLNHAGFIEFSASKPLALARSREEVSKETSKERARASDRSPAHARAQEENNHPAEPPVDPDALAKLRSIQQLIGRPL